MEVKMAIEIISANPNILDKHNAYVASLRKQIPTCPIITGEAGRRVFETDAYVTYKKIPMTVLLPSNSYEVSQILKFCQQVGIRVVARGTGTSVTGSALPMEDAIVLSLSRMTRLLEVNLESRYVRVETGMTNLGVSDAVRNARFFYAPDPSSQLACTIGGNIASNAGGKCCLRYGVTTNHVLGVKMVLMDGTITELGGAGLDYSGYDLLTLINGSEGQLGIVTEATLRIFPTPESSRTILLGFPSSEMATNCVVAIFERGIIPSAVEFMDKPAIAASETLARACSVLTEALLIIEVDGADAEITLLLNQIKESANTFEPTVLRISQSDAESAAIWNGWKTALWAIGRDYYCVDGVIPLTKLPEALLNITEICKKHKLPVANVIHAGDGNLHPFLFYNANDKEEKARVEACGTEILEMCVTLGGCLTGEHGVGIEKRELMSKQYNEVDIAQQMRVKSVFDPDWLLNPGKVFPLKQQEAFLTRVR
jgi:glycolate oxidase